MQVFRDDRRVLNNVFAVEHAMKLKDQLELSESFSYSFKNVELIIN